MIQDSLLLNPFYRLAAFKLDSTESKQSQILNLLSGLLIKIQQLPLLSPQLANTYQLLAFLGCLIVFVLASIATTEIIGLAMLLTTLLVIAYALAARVKLTLTGLDIIVSLFFISAVVSAAFSSYLSTNLEGLFKFFIYFCSYCSFRVLSVATQDDAQHTLISFSTLIKGLIIVGLVQALIGFYQYFTHVEALATWQDPTQDPLLQMTRVFGTLKPANPNLYAGFLLPMLGVCGGFKLRSFLMREWASFSVWTLCSALLLVAIVMSGSRGAFISLAAMGIVAFAYLGHQLWHHEQLKHLHRLKIFWLALLVLAVLMAVGAFGFVPALKARLMSIFALGQDSSNAYRITVWGSVIEMIKDNWLLGIGPGNDTFKQVYGLYMTTGYHALGAYCIWLEIAVEQGLIGLFIFMSFLVTMLVQMARVTYSAAALKLQTTLFALFLGIVGALGYGVFDTVWYRPSINILFWMLVAGFITYSYQALNNTHNQQN